MFSLKRIVFIILSVLAIGALFLVGNFFLSNSATNQEGHNASGQREFLAHSSIEEGDKPNVMVVGREDEADSSLIMSNVIQTCEDLQLSMVAGDEVEDSALSTCDILVFCDPSLSAHISNESLEHFIANGGCAIVAAGVSEELENQGFLQTLGIDAISGQEDYAELLFEEPLLPLQPEEIAYGGSSNSSRVEISSEATVYVRSDSDDTPLLYRYDDDPASPGSIFVINGTFLSESGNRGLLTGAISALMPDFVYPILGIKAVFLDNFPGETEENDALCQRLYGYSTERFMESVAWPAFQGMLLRTDTPYTASLLVEATSEEDFNPETGKVFAEIAKTLPQFNCELAFAANCEDQQPVVIDQNALEEFEEAFPTYTVKGLVLEGTSTSQQLFDIPGADIDCVRKTATANDVPIIWENKRAVLPAITEGNKLRSGEMLAIYSTIGAYGLISHSFDLKAMICDDNGQTAAWETDRWEIGAFESDILSRASWLEGRTLSHTKDDVKSYRTMEYGWTYTDEQIEIQCSDAVVGQAFLYHTSSKIAGAEGLSYQDLGNGFYLLNAESNHCVIQIEGRG